ncbi:MAG: hypothetical protein EBU08_17065, partial [Micrococcales bacterium]|nr:hypothetical protein [Micrococcales bacterium]
MGINQIPGVGPTNSDIATAVAAPSAATIASAVVAAAPTNSTIASAVAAAVPTNSSIAAAVGTSFNPLAMTAQQTFTTSSNNVVVSGKNFVYALVVGGGGAGAHGGNPGNIGTSAGGGGGGGIAFGLTPVSSAAIVGAGGNGISSPSSNTADGNSGSYSRYGNVQANGGMAAGFNINATTSGYSFNSSGGSGGSSGFAGTGRTSTNFYGFPKQVGPGGFGTLDQVNSLGFSQNGGNGNNGNTEINGLQNGRQFIGSGGGAAYESANAGQTGSQSMNYNGGTGAAGTANLGGSGGGGAGWLANGGSGSVNSGNTVAGA